MMAIRVRPGIEKLRAKSGTCLVRFVEWNSIRGTHQGQRSFTRTKRPDTRLLLTEPPSFKKFLQCRNHPHRTLRTLAVCIETVISESAIGCKAEHVGAAHASDLEAEIDAFVGHYNHRRYHESLGNLTPADVYFGRGQTILLERERIKQKPFETRCLQTLKRAA